MSSVRIGRVFGIPVEVHLSWLVIFGLVTLSLSTTYFPAVPQAAGQPTWLYVVVGSLTSLLFFASVLAHELSHSLVARAEGGNVDKITLFIFGGVAQIDEEPRTPGREFLMAAAGPGMSLLIAAVALVAASGTYARGLPWWVWAPLNYLSTINFALGLFNLLPGFPLDGGRVFRSILWAITGDLLKATLWASRSGQLLGWLMVAAAVTGVLNGRPDLIWFGLIGWFIASLAGNAYRQQVVKSSIEGIKVREIMSPSPQYVGGDLAVDQLVQQHFLGSRHSRYPVVDDGSVAGLVTLSDVKSVDRADWPFVRTLDISNRDLGQLLVDQDEPVNSLVPRLAGDKPGALLVVGEGRLVGIITRADVMTFVEQHRP